MSAPPPPPHGPAPMNAKVPKPMDPDKLLRLARNVEYPKELWYFIASLIALIAFAQLISRLHAKYSGKGRRLAKRSVITAADPESNSSQPSGSSRSIRRVPLALLNVYRTVAFRSTITIAGTYTLNLAEIFLMFAYIAALFTWAFINTTPNSTGVRLTPMFWSNRSGALVASQLPLVTLLGTKNNIIGFLTGVSFEKLNSLHRMAARVVFILTWVHAGSRIRFMTVPWDELFVRLGVASAVALSLLCIVSLRPIRSAAYEFFFYAHFILVLLLLVGAYIHAADNKPFNHYVWPALAIWALDRFIRTIRLVVFNHSYFGFKQGSGTLNATTELLSPGTVRLTFKRPRHFTWHPGQMAYLILPSVSALPFEAHPFTISSIDSSSSKTAKSSLSSEINANADTSELAWKELVFMISVRGGFTKRLAEVAARKENIKVFLDGPYGAYHDLSRFDTSVLIAGGTGVSYTLPLLLGIIDGVRAEASCCRRVVFIWSVRHAAHVKWISDTLEKALEMVPPSLKVEISIFVTGAAVDASTEWDLSQSDLSATSSATEKEESKEDIKALSGPPALLSSAAVSVTGGRPNLREILLQEADDSQDGDKISVDVCGSRAIAHSVRSALRFSPSRTLRRGTSVSLHVESFGYA